MELLKNEKYEKCKKIVKLWEHDFKKANGRLPSKLDIKEADKSVRDAYCMYFKLKTAALEESLNDIFNFESDEQKEKPSETYDVKNDVEVPENIDKKDKEDKVWGSHLNKPQKKLSATVQKKDNMNSSFTQKLFSNSKFAKRNPRKSLNASLKRNISMDASQIEKSLNETVNVVEDTEEEVKLKASLPVTTYNNVTAPQPVNIISELINKKGNIFNRNIDKGWLERVSANTVAGKSEETSTLDKHLDDLVYSGDESCDIISDSDVEDHPISKRIKLTHKNTSFNQINSINIKNSNINKEIKPSDILNTSTVKRESVTTKPLEEPVTTKLLEKPLKEVVENKILISDKSFVPENKVETAAVKNEEKSETVAPSNAKKRKKNSSVKTRSSTRRTSRKTGKPPEKDDNNITDDTYEPEFSHKPPPETVPRSKSLLSDVQNKPIAEIEKPKPFDKKQHAKEKLLKRIESGTLNENYVKIDIKKKVFVKGKKNMNFTKYKKQQWKNKKKSLYGDDFGCDGGTLTCFKCGKTGHFARQCKAEFVDKLLPLEAVGEEECPLPSLEEACKMAQENCLAVHVPNLKKTTLKDESVSEKSSQPTKEIETDKEVLSSSEDESDKVDVFEFEDDEEFNEFALNNSFEVQSEKDVENSNIVKPYYELKPDGSVIDTPAEVYEALNKFGHSSFNFGQEQAIMRILSGLSTLVTLSTGSGKSLCYQLPAYLYAKRSKCITLVISPLISLMEDQVSGIPGFLKAACYHTMRSQTQRDKVLQLLDDGEIDVLLVSPETIITGEKKSGFGSLLKRLPPIAFVCIDEAHCVSQWSHNFRPSYLMICRVLRERLGIKTVLGLTATSTRVTTISITKHLQITDDQAGVISDIPLPENLHLSVSHDLHRDEALNNILTTEPFRSYDSIVIYCTRREECERIATYLRTGMRFATESKSAKKYKSISSIAEPYHAGLSGSKRKTVQNAFMCGHLRIVVATIAFGMGINKSNIRGIIHYNMPKNFENYVQEVGRAGRDGLPAHCHLFLDSEGRDQHELRRHINANTTDRHVIRKLLKKIFVPCECKDYCPKHEVAFSVEDTVRELDVPEENISTLLCYLELHEKRYIETLTPAYIHCKIITYGTTQQLNKAAKECPPLAMALALHGKSKNKNNTFEFPVIDVAAAMGWDSGFVKRQLKSLEWTRENNAPKRTTLTVEFSNLGFHVRAPGNLSSNELDDALDSLFAKKKEQELMSLKQLQIVHTTLTSVAEKSYNLCTTDEYQVKAKELKYKIRQYFSSDEPLKDVEVVYNTECNENQIAADVRSLITMYRDNNFTGRAVARIFHGIQSPNYPAVIWGRCKLWRAHLNTEFTKVHQIASREILKYK